MAAKYELPEGYQVYGNSVIAYLDSDDNLVMNVSAPNVMIPSEDKLSVLAAHPACVPGTVAFTPGFQGVWQIGIDGTWVDMLQEENSNADNNGGE